ncbi:tetratricopeptide repeat protein [Croceibacterium sp. LX-88]|jgi:cytochrome c-type biogenesis protein CcmH|uniref:Tetratricopeptide repeat protein n=1 Tax=Croceibacterium selenioxidans TaxID=2838833 RepID=A0ABS5W4E5_9SPHN|nr:tetratricopeptide repeat protein [Croceibacterium selenioxidans]MBT2134085.1 tetratricopeptide repeat protein [Croceibacterium selenioxidans]
MTWLVAVAIALAAFALAAFVLGVPRQGWTSFAAALALGLAGYALQASPGVPGAPAAPRAAGEIDSGFSYVDERKEMIGSAARSGSDKLLIADALARKGQFANAAAMLRGAVHDNPRDAEAWLALGNALVEHSGGVLTEPSLVAYRRASELDAKGVGPGYFLGLALIRQGQLMEARGVWQATVENAPEDSAGRALLEQRLARLDALITQISGQAPVPQQE